MTSPSFRKKTLLEPFNRDEKKVFINLYLSQENLWNTTSPDYLKKEVRNASYRTISRGIAPLINKEMTCTEVASKIQSIRSSYCRELVKMRNFERSPASAYSAFSSQWEYFPILDSFLRSHVQEKINVRTRKNVNRKSEESLNSDDVSTEIDSSGETGSPMPVFESPPVPKMARLNDMSKCGDWPKQENGELKEELSMTSPAATEKRKRPDFPDDISAFTQYIDAFMRTLKSPAILLKFKRGVNELVYECQNDQVNEDCSALDNC